MFNGVLNKMRSEINGSVSYFLDMGNEFLISDSILNKNLTIHFEGFSCLNCQSNQEIFRQGHCKKCFFESPNTAEWIIRPELSQAHLGIKHRDLEYEKKIQLQPHLIYLSFTSDIKVGVTRKSQIPTRWIDQGAIEAIELAEFPNRYLAGICEIELKKYFKDKTNWRTMLIQNKSNVDLLKKKNECYSLFPNELKKYFLKEAKVLKINYPILNKIVNPKSINLKKLKTYSGKLIGVKGQYLIFEDYNVLNVRSNEGVVVKIEID
jgi:hypothetical protein|tara:strand:+ start:3539 stop:4330 length:792 start_codon:yes stop_codon:yes gene_type:complete